ncbi:VOC family protein [Chryseobacterium sp. MYb264]|uniref:VOC family protein n=1 Tax=Chryseobacterium sp. MYb264 TaxID=2745153 RepID=UPI002E0F93EA|nr:VOC family protein [Chryseobacterium sp. MYb264]
MTIVSTRIITTKVDTLIVFYEKITGFKATRYTPDFAELQTANSSIAIGSTATLALFGGDHIARAASNQSTITEFLVHDVDLEFKRLKDYLSSSVVQEPTVMPWGNKSMLFRDPDGNLINFFTPVSKEAVEKFSAKMNEN